MSLAHNMHRKHKMLRFRLWLCVGFILLVVWGIMPEGEAQARYTRTVNWTRMDQALKKAEQASETEEDGIRKITLPYEHLRNLTAIHLIRAAEEGIQVARIQMKGRPQVMLDRQIDVNIGRAFSGYPYVAPGKDGYMALLDLLKDGTHPEPVRIYILKRVVPGMASIDPFALYLQDQARLYVDMLNNILGKLSIETIEKPGIKIQAMNTLYQSFYTKLTALLREDTAVQEKEAVLKRPIVPMDLKAPAQVTLSRRIQNNYTKNIGNIESLYTLVDGIAKNQNSPASVIEAAKDLLTRITNEVPITARPSTRVSKPQQTTPTSPDAAITPNPILEFDLGLPKL